MKDSSSRETFATRIGFLAMSAGCAIGLGNVWRFPYITGRYGGAVFVLIYLIFLLILGLPVMMAELALGRASQSDLPGAYRKLAGKRSGIWSGLGTFFFLGNALLLMFYFVVSGWMFAYFWKFLTGSMAGCTDPVQTFGNFCGNWQEMLIFNFAAIAVTSLICAMGVRGGIERAMKIMLGGLFVLQIIMIVLVLQNKGAGEGLRFFLSPDLDNLRKAGLWPVIHAAMMQAFFTLSLGIGCMTICGSYTGKEHTLCKESLLIILLDTIAAVSSGLIIFPACSAFHLSVDQGPPLLFVTLTKVFTGMGRAGIFLGILFFLFMSVAALSTLVAVGENIIAWMIRVTGFSRGKATLLFAVAFAVLTLPCLFGFNLLRDFQPMGKGSCVLDLEDFLLSDNLLPLGSLAILFFCTWRSGWGSEGFLAEINTGKGPRMSKSLCFYMKWFLPLMIGGLWAHNIVVKLLGI